MKHTHTARPRTLALLLAATVLPATPVLAQEAAAPPVSVTVPTSPAPAAPTAPVAATPAPVFAPRAEVVQPVPVRPAPAPEVAAEPASRPSTTRTARATPTRAAPVAAPNVAAPAAAAPVAAPPVTEAAPVAAPIPTSPAAEATFPETAPAADGTTSTTTVTDQTPWLWIVGGLVALGAIIALLFSRRRRPAEEASYEEPTYAAPPAESVALSDRVEPAAFVAPSIVPVTTPVAVETPTRTPVTPVADDERPWIGLSLQATGSNAQGDSDLVEYNLIVENAGDVMANDVQVSTFLIDSKVKSSGAESSLIDAVGETQSRFIDLAPGTSVPIASTLSVPHGVEPCILAEARYPLPGGGEGHIAARFVIENGSGDTVEARLDDVLERV